MNNTLEDLAVAVASASEIAVALKIPFKFEVDFPKVDVTTVEPIEICWDQVRHQNFDSGSGIMRLVVRVHDEDWAVVIPPALHPEMFHSMLNALEFDQSSVLPLSLRRVITTHILENS